MMYFDWYCMNCICILPSFISVPLPVALFLSALLSFPYSICSFANWMNRSTQDDKLFGQQDSVL